MARGDVPPTHRQVQDSAHVQGQETPELGSHRGGVNSILLTTEKTPAPCVRPTSSPGLSLNLGKYWFKEEKRGPHCVGAAGESFPIWLGAPSPSGQAQQYRLHAVSWWTVRRSDPSHVVTAET